MKTDFLHHALSRSTCVESQVIPALKVSCSRVTESDRDRPLSTG
ncbi:MAG: hypothetical protein ACLFT0_18835 [Spirulinaceae cyanobacterium]